jgi:hypothetical protein
MNPAADRGCPSTLDPARCYYLKVDGDVAQVDVHLLDDLRMADRVDDGLVVIADVLRNTLVLDELPDLIVG